MKNWISVLLLSAFLLFSGELFSQTKKHSDLDNQVDSMIDELESLMEEFDLNELFSNELPNKLQEITPSEQEMDEIQSFIKEGMSVFKEMDLSELENLMKNMELQMRDLSKDLNLKDLEPKPSDKKTKRKIKKT